MTAQFFDHNELTTSRLQSQIGTPIKIVSESLINSPKNQRSLGKKFSINDYCLLLNISPFFGMNNTQMTPDCVTILDSRHPDSFYLTCDSISFYSKPHWVLKLFHNNKIICPLLCRSEIFLPITTPDEMITLLLR